MVGKAENNKYMYIIYMCVWKCKQIVSQIHIFIWFWLQKPCAFPSVPSTGILTKKCSLFEGFPSLTMTKNPLHCHTNLAYNTMTDIIIKFNIVEMQHCNRSSLMFGFIIEQTCSQDHYSSHDNKGVN